MPREIEIIPFAANELPADYLFTQRKYYSTDSNVYLLEEGTPKPIDIWYERPLWGKVDPEQRVIFPFDQALKPIGNNLSAINFVADAYTDFKRFTLQARESYRSSVASFINVERPVKAYENPFYRFEDYFIDELQPVFMNDYLDTQKRKTINTFINFIEYYLSYVDINANIPHTLCGFILSPRMSYRNSGLIIDFSDDNPGRDSIKWTKYLSNDFFQEYIKIAASYGFYINKNTPWSIVANLNSSRLKRYMNNYAINSMDRVFQSYYFQAENISYNLYKNFMILSYFSFIASGASVEEIISYKNCMKKSIEQSSFKTNISLKQKSFELGDVGAYSLDAFLKVYSDEVYLNYYIDIRLKEEATNLSKKETKKLKQQILRILNTKTIEDACLAFSNFMAKKRSANFKDLTDKNFSLKIPTKKTSEPSASSYFAGSAGSSTNY